LTRDRIAGATASVKVTIGPGSVQRFLDFAPNDKPEFAAGAREHATQRRDVSALRRRKHYKKIM
jgi:hypothetical protein